MNYNFFADISSPYIICFLAGTMASSAISNFLDWRNSSKGNISSRTKILHSLHPLMKKFFSRTKVNKAIEYNSETKSFSDFRDSLESCSTMLCLMFGVCPFLLYTLSNATGSGCTVSYLLFFTIITIAKSSIATPFELYNTFIIEKKYGFNSETRSSFFIDKAKGLVFSLVIGSLLICAVNFILVEFGPFSTWKTILFVLGTASVGMIFEFLYMTVVIRIFNKVTPLKDGNLKRRVMKLLEAYGYKNVGVYVMDESRRSTKSNAFIGGIWKSKKIVLFDNLLKKYSNDEIMAILGHELAHGKLHHLAWNRIASLVRSIMVFFFMFTMTYDIDLYHAFGFTFVTKENIMDYSLIGLILSNMVVGSISWVLDPLNAYLSRSFEYAADRQSVKYNRKKEPMISALIKLTSENLGDPIPDPLYESYNYGHPSISNRINAIRKTSTK